MADDTQNPPPPPPPPEDSKPTGANAKPHAAEVDNEAGMSFAPKALGQDGLGQQVHPDTQTTEADGHRTLANPVQDPGPYRPEGSLATTHPDRNKGEHRYGDVNDTIPVMMRTSTGHDLGFARPDGDPVTLQQLPPEVAVNGAASDCYHPSNGKETSLTAAAQELASKGREPAPLHE